MPVVAVWCLHNSKLLDCFISLCCRVFASKPYLLSLLFHRSAPFSVANKMKKTEWWRGIDYYSRNKAVNALSLLHLWSCAFPLLLMIIEQKQPPRLCSCFLWLKNTACLAIFPFPVARDPARIAFFLFSVARYPAFMATYLILLVRNNNFNLACTWL